MINQQTDALIIGFGKGGKTLAPFLAKQGWKVTVVEQSPAMYGGTCINIACIPTKALVQAAEEATKKGLDFESKAKEFEEAWKSKEELVAFLRSKNHDNLISHPGVKLITGKASFISPHEVTVEKQGEESIVIQAKQIFINTGAVPFMPDLPVESNHIYNSTSLLSCNVLPRRLAIVGSGFIGLEFASIYANFGSEVTVIERGEEILKQEDHDLREEVQRVLESKGIRFIFSSKVQRIQDIGDDTIITIQKSDGSMQQLEVDAVLFATGRKPYTEGLMLEKAGIQSTEKGFIAVDDALRTNVPHIRAIGDINGGPQFTYISLDDYRIIRSQLFGDKSRTRKDRKNVPISVFITPVLAKVGLTEAEALKAGYRIKVGKLPATASPRARILKQTNGFLKPSLMKTRD